MATSANRWKEILTLVIVFAGVLLISALAVYVIGGRGTSAPNTSERVQEPPTSSREPIERRSTTPEQGDGTFVDQLFGNQNNDVLLTGERWAATVGKISLRHQLKELRWCSFDAGRRGRLRFTKNPRALTPVGPLF